MFNKKKANCSLVRSKDTPAHKPNALIKTLDIIQSREKWKNYFPKILWCLIPSLYTNIQKDVYFIFCKFRNLFFYHLRRSTKDERKRERYRERDRDGVKIKVMLLVIINYKTKHFMYSVDSWFILDRQFLCLNIYKTSSCCKCFFVVACRKSHILTKREKKVLLQLAVVFFFFFWLFVVEGKKGFLFSHLISTFYINFISSFHKPNCRNKPKKCLILFLSTQKEWWGKRRDKKGIFSLKVPQINPCN